MYYFYVLQFKNKSAGPPLRRNGKLYKGLTNDLRRRIKEHKGGKSDFTSRNGDFDLIFYEAYIDKKDAEEAERYFKTGHGREVLRQKLRNYFGGVA